jgi:7SK snRNA methylphosphate capping enzyme
MATTTAPEDAPSAAKGAKGEAKRKQSNWRGGGGEGGQGQKRKRKEVFVYGNYRNYYGYRVSEHPPLPLSLLLRARRSLLCV